MDEQLLEAFQLSNLVWELLDLRLCDSYTSEGLKVADLWRKYLQGILVDDELLQVFLVAGAFVELFGYLLDLVGD